MLAYLARRALQMVPILLGVVTIIFVLLRLSGDPVRLYLPEDATHQQIAQVRSSLGLDRPIYVQYGIYIARLVKGDLGESIRYRNQDVAAIVMERLPATLELAGASLLVAILISLPLGTLAALNRNRLPDLLSSAVAMLGRAMPNFWVGIMLILFFGIRLEWFPVSGRNGIGSLVLPALTLGASMAALLMRLVRSGMLEVMSQDYVRTAKAKGLPWRTVVVKHGLRNALISYVTVLGLEVAGLMAGAVITEQVFAWPGIGRLAIQAISSLDMSIVQAVVILASVVVMVANLVVDLMYALIDPRVRYA
ncbi:MAG TPA: ABC transporter permease [Trueperaceae bacterium]|nr:ABC transporter permease [Trueperaceae bacterium]